MNEQNNSMTEELNLMEHEFADNANTRTFVVLCLDTSSSMDVNIGDSKPIKELNEGVRIYFNDIKSDSIARYSVETCLIKYGNQPQIISDFKMVDEYAFEELTAYGLTPMGQAVNMALDKAEERKLECKSNGIAYWEPVLLLMSDGMPTDDIELAVKRTVEMVNNRKIVVYPIAIGEHADLDVLSKFSPNRRPLRIKEGKMKDFFSMV